MRCIFHRIKRSWQPFPLFSPLTAFAMTVFAGGKTTHPSLQEHFPSEPNDMFSSGQAWHDKGSAS